MCVSFVYGLEHLSSAQASRLASQAHHMPSSATAFAAPALRPSFPATSRVPPALGTSAAVYSSPAAPTPNAPTLCHLCHQIAGAVLTVLSVTVYMAYQYRLSVQQAPQKEAAEEVAPAAEAPAAAAAAVGGGRPLGAKGAE